MTKEEFKEKFKEGDKITNSLIDKSPDMDYMLVISTEGDWEDVFTGVLIKDGKKVDLISGSKTLDLNWQHYKEPVKKDLEGLNKYYIIRHKCNNVEVVYARSKKEINTWKERGDRLEKLTEEEAIERGLKV